MSTQLIQKQFYIKVYDPNGNYLTTWSSDIISEPSFRTVINGGPGQMVIRLARKYDNFGEGTEVNLDNTIQVWVADADNIGNNLLPNTLWDKAMWDSDVWDTPLKSYVNIYGGYISAYAATVDDDEEYVDVTVLGYVSDISYKLLIDGSGNTTITYTNTDPSAIMRDVIDKYRADGGTKLNYTQYSIQNTGTTVNYTFQHALLKDVLDEIVALSPDNWFYFVDKSGVVYFKQASLNQADHQLTLGKDVLYSQTTKRTENIINEVSVIDSNDPPLYNIYRRQSSITSHSKHTADAQQGVVINNATADAIAKRILDMEQNPETRSVIRVLDNNGGNSNIGQNIEQFQIGDSIQLKNLGYGQANPTFWDTATWDVSLWNDSLNYTTSSIMTIVSLTYTPDYIEIEASSRLPEVPKELQTLNKLISQQFLTNIGVKPTVRVV